MRTRADCRPARESLLSCQLRPNSSSVEGAKLTAGRSLPGMSLAFALLAAFNGSTGSCATLSHGLELRHQASPASARRQKDFHSSWATAQAVPDAVAQTEAVVGKRQRHFSATSQEGLCRADAYPPRPKSFGADSALCRRRTRSHRSRMLCATASARRRCGGGCRERDPTPTEAGLEIAVRFGSVGAIGDRFR